MPSRQSRSSLSRRDRNRALYAAVVSGLVVIAGLILLVMSRADPTRGAALRGAALDLTAPVWTIARKPFEWAGAVGRAVDDYFFAISRNRELEKEHLQVQKLRQQRDALLRENRQLKGLLRVAEPRRTWSRVLPISGASAGSYVRSATIGGGSAQGIRPGQPVRALDGLVGQVVEVGRNAARVLLLTDTSSRVPVRVVRTGKPAMLAGVNGALLEVRYMAPADGVLKRGDRLVTSGDGGVFPPDVPVAVVVGYRGETPLARPLARPDGLGYVVVERPYLPPVILPPLTPIVPPALPATTP